MSPTKRLSYWLRACVRCGGDCVKCGGEAYGDLIDEPEWRCVQCRRVVPPELLMDNVAAPMSDLTGQLGVRNVRGFQ